MAEEVVTERTTEAPGSYSSLLSWKLEQFVYYIGGVVVSVLILRVFLQLMGANPGSPFVDFIYRISYPLVAPFFGIFNSTPSFGVGRLETEAIVAMVVWAIVTAGVAQLVRLLTR